jgi:hypothetical protein
MITALVQFKLPQPITREKAQQLFVRSRPARIGVVCRGGEASVSIRPNMRTLRALSRGIGSVRREQ